MADGPGSAATAAMDAADLAEERERRLTIRLGRRLVALLVAVALLLSGAGAWIGARIVGTLELERLATEGEVIENAMAGLLSLGLPLNEFVGFPTVSRTLLAADPTITAVAILDEAGTAVFASPADRADALGGAGWETIGRIEAGDRPRLVQRRASTVRVVLPISDRFREVGSVAIFTASGSLAAPALPVAGAAALLLLLLLGGAAVHALVVANPLAFRSSREIYRSFLVTAVLALAIVAGALAVATREALERQANAFAESIAARLGQAVALGLDPKDLSGLAAVLDDYRESNPTIGYIALVEGNDILAAAGLPADVTRWRRQSRGGDWVIEIRPRDIFHRQLRIAVGDRADLVLSHLSARAWPLLALALALALAAYPAIRRWITVRAPSR